KGLDEGAAKIAEGLAAGERGKRDFEEGEKKVGEVLGEGGKEVWEMVGKGEKGGGKMVEEGKEEGCVEGVGITGEGKGDGEEEMNGGGEVLGEQVGGLAVKGAESLLRSEVDTPKHPQLL
ncbi:F0F1 ATP synthase subunit B, partial [Neisseria sicca]|uniref:F0F1 ATP synthase subunit B n=1 Tax=Neisseria sicca TaxID=490 RepID=UPI0011BD0487